MKTIDMNIELLLDAAELLNDGCRQPDPRQQPEIEDEDEEPDYSGEESDFEYTVRHDYSGRYMYGEQTPSIKTGSRTTGLEIGAAIALAALLQKGRLYIADESGNMAEVQKFDLIDLWDELRRALPRRCDSMGLGTIYY